MSKTGALDLASGLGGKITKEEVKSAVDEYEKYHGYYGGKEEARKSNYTDMVNKYYDLATSFYEYGWGESFHFAHRWNGESLRESIKRHEHFLALQLVLKPGMKVLDVGCGIGGPLREIARFSSTSVTGLNNNEYQISRGKELNRLAGVSGTCNSVKVCWLTYFSTFPSWFSSFVCFAVLSSLLFGRARGLSSAVGHEAGRRLLEETVRLSHAWGIHALTAFTFSKENWSRPKVEVDFLMRLFERVIHDSVAEFLR